MYECSCLKVDFWMPEDLIERVRGYVGAAKFDRYVVAAVAQRLRQDSLDDLSAYLQARFGPIPTEALEETAKTWPNFEAD